MRTARRSATNGTSSDSMCSHWHRVLRDQHHDDVIKVVAVCPWIGGGRRCSSSRLRRALACGKSRQQERCWGETYSDHVARLRPSGLHISRGRPSAGPVCGSPSEISVGSSTSQTASEPGAWRRISSSSTARANRANRCESESLKSSDERLNPPPHLLDEVDSLQGCGLRFNLPREDLPHKIVIRTKQKIVAHFPRSPSNKNARQLQALRPASTRITFPLP